MYMYIHTHAHESLEAIIQMDYYVTDNIAQLIF